MAIKSDKLLDRPSELHRRYSGRLAMQKSLQEKMVGGASGGVVLSKKSIKSIEIMRSKVTQIESILKGTLAVEKKELDNKKRLESGKRREKQEEKLETKPNVESGQVKMPSAPKLGILDWIKNFIGKIILGYFAVRLIDHLPKLIPFLKFLGSAADFIINIGGDLLNGLVTFIDAGYKAYDATRGFVKNLFGDAGVKQFDQLSSVLNKFLNLAIIAGMVAAGSSGRGGATAGAGVTVAGRPTRTTSGGKPLAGPDIRNPFRERPRITEGTGGQPSGPKLPGSGPKITGDVSGGGGKFQLPSKSSIRAGGIVALVALIPSIINSGMLASQGRGKDAVRTFLSAVAGVGAGMAATAGVTAGAAALGITGVGLPAAIALAITGFAASSAASFLAYEGTDALLRKMGLVDKDPKTGKPYAYRGGGITRGGKAQGGVKRTIGGVKKKGVYKRTLAKNPTQTRFKTTDKKVKQISEDLDKTQYFGPILSVAAKVMQNEKPDKKDYENAGLGLNLLIAKGIEDGQLKGGLVAAFAEGGMVDDEFLSAAEKGSDISNWIARTFNRLFESRVEQNLRLIKERQKEKPGPAGVPGSEQPGDPSTVNIQGGSADFWTLVAIVSREDADPQGSADVAQSIYNRLASGAYTGKTIKDLITAGGQYEPTWQYPKGAPNIKNKPNPEWFAIKDAASAAAASGMSEEAMKSVAASILNPTLQENARQFVQGRTDFKGANSGGPPSIQRKGGDNWFGWEYNYKQNKIGSVPNFGATATAAPGSPGGTGPGMTGPLGTGRASSVDQFTPIAKQFKLGVTSAYRAGDRGYHGLNRARDYSNDTVGRGTPEQLKFAQHLVQNYGSSLTQLIYTPLGFGIANGKRVGLDYWGEKTNAAHYHHVHVALEKGGRVRKLTKAILAEKGPEFVFDADTTAGLDRLAPQLLERLNMAETKPQLSSILQSYTDYEQSYAEPEIIEVPVPMPFPLETGGDGSAPAMSGFGGGGGGDDYAESLYKGG